MQKLDIKDIINNPNLNKPVLKTITTEVDGEPAEISVYVKKVSFATAHDMTNSYDIDFDTADGEDPKITNVNNKQLQAIQIYGSICDENGKAIFKSADQVLTLEGLLANELYRVANEVNNFLGKSESTN